MAKSRKKKKPQTPPSIKKDFDVTKSYFDKFSIIARKTLQVIGLDPALYDKFTKKQKIEMMRAKMDVPRFVVKKGHSVPRHYVRMIQQESYEFMRIYPVGDREINLTYMDYLTMGNTFLMFMLSKGNSKDYCEQAETYALIAKRAKEYDDGVEADSLLLDYCTYLQYLLFNVSKINFRMYGFEWQWRETDYTGKFAAHIILTATEPKKEYFKFNDISRPAYKIAQGQFLSEDPNWLSVSNYQIFKQGDQALNISVYIQNHALLRLKERLDTLEPFERNYMLQFSLRQCNIFRLNSGQYTIKFINSNQELIGYLPFTIIGQKLLVLSFLPITSPATPEGKLLCEALKLNKEMLSYYAMDKLSFFHNTDFDAIPILKEAIVNAGMWHLTEIRSIEKKKENEVKHVGLIAKFIQQNISELNKEEVLSEIEERY